MSVNLCPCQSGQLFNQCCQPYLSGAMQPSTPVALMQSRYTAYTQHNAAYLIKTWHLAPEQNALLLHSLEENFQKTRWAGLKIINTFDDPKNPDQSFVEFLAYFFEDGCEKKHILHERSRFILLNQNWLYVDGIKPKIERNAECPCGSGKKYKKCCY